MQFELLPVVDIMLDLYKKPRTTERFQEYLELLQGNTKGDLVIPIGGFNPMAKEHAFQKLKELKTLCAEALIQQTLDDVNKKIAGENKDTVFKVALNLADDLKGGWTNRYTTDYDSKFAINALQRRNFCIPLFWTSEQFYPELIKTRTLQYACRTIYWLTHPKPKTLKDHVAQEKFVSKNAGILTEQKQTSSLESVAAFYTEHQHTDNYHIIFNFFYGDEASASLSFPRFGITARLTGFEYAANT